MSIHFEHAIDIARSPEDVFALIDDFSQTPGWLSSCEGIEKVTPDANMVGTKLRYLYRDATHHGTMEGQITRRIPGKRLSFEYADKSVAVTADFQLTATAEGTHLVHTIEVTPQTFLARLASPLIRSQLTRQTLAAMEALRSVLERHAEAIGEPHDRR